MNSTLPRSGWIASSRELSRAFDPLRALGMASVIGWLLVSQARAAGVLSVGMLLGTAGYVLICLAYGTIFERVTAAFVANRVGLAYPLLAGYFVFNSLLFMAALALPSGMAVNVAVLAIVALLGLGLVSLRPRVRGAAIDEFPGLICLFVAGAVATLWTSDLQPMMEIQGRLAVFRAWQDVFIHVREISAFAQAHGWISMSDIKMAGASAPAYHFASYVSTAAMATLTSTSALAAFGGFQMPLGILLMSIAAFVLVGSFWDVWPAMIAAVGVATLPDAYQQGFGSAYLGFHFMSQVNPGMLYGIACMAMAWVFMIEGCRRASYRAVAIAYGFLALCLLYKAHLFVANAFLLLIFPCVYFAGLRLRWRILIGGFFIALFVVTVQVSQHFPRVPTIRLDGSGIASYLRILVDLYQPGAVKQALRSFFFVEHHSKVVDGVAAAALIFLCSFGVWALIAPIVSWKSRKKIPQDLWAFPILVVANYMVMALGLAIEARGIGTPEELQNRPMAWAYFVLVTFSIAGLVHLWMGRHTRVSREVRWGLVGLGCLALVSVGIQAANFQTIRAIRGFGSYVQFNAVPLCQVRAADYIRRHGQVGDLMQDSGGDPRFVSTAIAERQAYVAFTGFGGHTAGWDDRIRTIEAIQRSGDVTALEALARRDHVSWYLLHPEDAASWPRSFLDSAAYECSGFRVIRLVSQAG